jgi:hexosaminidase
LYWDWYNTSAGENYYNNRINWNNLVYRLGTNNSKYLGYLSNIINPSDDDNVMPYRGYPKGISSELPKPHHD